MPGEQKQLRGHEQGPPRKAGERLAGRLPRRPSDDFLLMETNVPEMTFFASASAGGIAFQPYGVRSYTTSSFPDSLMKSV